jgi:hypothetical protein
MLIGPNFDNLEHTIRTPPRGEYVRATAQASYKPPNSCPIRTYLPFLAVLALIVPNYLKDDRKRVGIFLPLSIPTCLPAVSSDEAALLSNSVVLLCWLLPAHICVWPKWWLLALIRLTH